MNKIINWFKNEYKKLIVFLFLYLIMIFPLPYYIDSPGGAHSVAKDIQINNEVIENEVFYKSFVSVYRGRLPILIYAFFNPNWDINSVASLPEQDYELSSTINRLYLEQANQIATIVAFEHSDKNFAIKKEEMRVINIIEKANTDLQIGDVLYQINFDELVKRIAEKEIGDEIIIKVKRDGQLVETKSEIITVDNEAKIGIMGIEYYTITSDPTITIKPEPQSEGPSGAFLLALTIYNQLSENPLTDKKIAGSGTLNIDGTIGSISGLKYKLLGAAHQDFDYFLVGNDNYEEAKTIVEKNELDINIKGFYDFQAAIDYFYNGKSNFN